MRIFRNATIAVAACCLASTGLWAQTFSTAQITGAVRDASGLAVPGVEVRVTQTGTGQVRTTTTGADGGYVLPNLPIGPYLLEASKAGFTKYVQSGIVLQVASNPSIDVVLAVGSVNEQVTVQADATMVEEHSSGVGTVVGQQQVVDLPLNGREATQLIFLAGAATLLTNSIASNRNYPTIGISVGGGIGGSATFLMDGGAHNDPYSSLNLPVPFPDALQEFKVETSALPAQYGQHASAAVNLVTKSGTNEFHGDAFEFLRNGDLNARDFFALARDSLKRNQFGGVLGGPVKKDKLFFFAGWQDTVQRSNPGQNISNVPTADELAGNFQTFASTTCQAKPITISAAQGFVNNMISPALIDPVALKMERYLPPTTSPCGIVHYGVVTNQGENQGIARIDYQKSSKNSIFVRYFIANLDRTPSYDGVSILSVGTSSGGLNRAQTATVGDTYLFSPNIVNSFRVTGLRTSDNGTNVPTVSAAGLGININVQPAVGSFTEYPPNFAVAGGPTIGAIQGTPQIFNTTTGQVSDDVSYVHGAHQFGFGVNYLNQQLNTNGGINTYGVYAFNGSVTGLGMADYLTGRPATYSQSSGQDEYTRLNYLALYAQDSWKVSSRLSLSLGLRWEPYIPITWKNGDVFAYSPANFNAGIGSTVYPLAPPGLIYNGDPGFTAGHAISDAKMDLFAPRIGLVWDPRGNGRMTVRASYGIFHDQPEMTQWLWPLYSPPFGTTKVLNVPVGGTANPYLGVPGGDPFPIITSKTTPFGQFATYVVNPQHPQPTYINQWNFSIQRQLGTSWLVSGSYIGNSTIHFWVSSGDLNEPLFLGTGPCTIPGPNGASNSYPVCSTVANTNMRRPLYLQNPNIGQYYGYLAKLDQGGTASYNAMLLSVQKRLSRGVAMQANYTWSHCLGFLPAYTVGTGAGASQSGSTRDFDRGNCSGGGDRRQVLNLSTTAETPQFSQRTLRMLASGWRVSGIISAQSAQYFNVTLGVDNALNAELSQRPSIVASPYAANQSVTQWLNTAAFVTPPVGTLGNLGYGNLRGPGFFQLDMSLARVFRIREKQTFEFRLEGFNVPNRLNASTPVATTNSGLFGHITTDVSGSAAGQQAGDPRILQVAGKFVF